MIEPKGVHYQLKMPNFFSTKVMRIPVVIGDYKVDHSLSNKRIQMYHHAGLNRTVVIHGDTQDARDVANDCSRKVQKAAGKKYGAKNVSALGHSLGSLTAPYVGQK